MWNRIGQTIGSGINPHIDGQHGPCAECEVEHNEINLKTISGMRNAGCDLAEVAICVINDYDGLHRLVKAVSVWMEVI